MKLFRSIPVYIHPLFWLMAFFIAWMQATSIESFVLWILVVFVSVLVHELGHAVTALSLKQQVHIELVPMGGVTVRSGATVGKCKEFIIVLMGPVAGFLLAGLGFLCLEGAVWPYPLFYFFKALVAANIFWSILNLLPVQPLDGGKLLSICCEALFGRVGIGIAYFISGLFAIVCAFLFFSVGSLLGGSLFLLFAFDSFKSCFQGHYFRASDRDDVVMQQIKQAQEAWNENDPEKAIALLQQCVQNEPQSNAYFVALERLIDCLLAVNQNKRAYALLEAHKGKLSGGLLKQMQLSSYKIGEWKMALECGTKVFSEEQAVSSAILNSFASAHLGNTEEAINWLLAVKRANGQLLPTVLESEELDAIREQPLFRQFLATKPGVVNP